MKSILLFLSCIIFIQDDNKAVLYEFTANKSISDWIIVDDGVMGGISKGTISLNENGDGLYTGDISTENNGGFSSVRLQFDNTKVTDYSAVLLKIKGDKKEYQFRIKSTSDQYYSYVNTFKTNGEWQEVRIPFNTFKPYFRGRLLDKKDYSGEIMAEVAFLIGNKKNESFQLEISRISLVK